MLLDLYEVLPENTIIRSAGSTGYGELLIKTAFNLDISEIETMAQYDWAVKRVEELLPLVTDETPLDDSNSIELELLSNLVADYSEEHFAL